MKVILLKDIKGTGKKGDILEVSDGHGRNYLMPRGLAKEASDSNVRELSHIKATEQKKKDNELQEAKDLATRLEEMTVVVKSKSGEGGKLFGSITTKEIAELLEKQHKVKIDKKKMHLDIPIKSLGVTKVEVKLHSNVTCSVKVHVVEE